MSLEMTYVTMVITFQLFGFFLYTCAYRLWHSNRIDAQWCLFGGIYVQLFAGGGGLLIVALERATIATLSLMCWL